MTLTDRVVPSVAAAASRSAAVRMTPEEFLSLPDAQVEYVNGECVAMSPVSLPHALLFKWLLRYLDHLVLKSDLGTVYPDQVTVKLSRELMRVPDLCFVAKANTRVAVHPNHLEGPPDLIVEIVSPESRMRDLFDKRIEYQSAGVTEYWILDPVYQSIDLLRLNASGVYEVIEATEGALRSAVIPGMALRAEWLKLPSMPNPDSLL
jgi:Uma2 family endonuclease